VIEVQAPVQNPCREQGSQLFATQVVTSIKSRTHPRVHVVRQRDVHSFNPPALKLAKARRLFADSSPEADSVNGMSSMLGPSITMAELSAGCAVKRVTAKATDQNK
jgi:hypothetical protein